MLVAEEADRKIRTAAGIKHLFEAVSTVSSAQDVDALAAVLERCVKDLFKRLPKSSPVISKTTLTP
jgi:hypothetical protein